jgi:hypothetical protein
MEKFVTKIFHVALVFIVSGITVYTSGSAVFRVLNKSEANAVNPTTSEMQEPTPSPRRELTPSTTPIPTAISIPKAKITPQNVTPTSISNKCIVTLFESLYDVTSLKISHSGGDIFNCGSDMTSIYQGEHGSGLSRMSAYLYDPNNPNKSVSTPVKSGRNREREDSDDD